MSIGIFTADDNSDRLERLQARIKTLRAKRRTEAEQIELEEAEAAAEELNQWFMDRWRIEGGGAP